MENFERQMADHADTENRAQHGKDGAKTPKNKFAAGLRKVSHKHLAELHQAVAGELERRAKEHAKAKPPGQMSRDQFEKFSAKEIGKAADTAKRKKEHTL
jgi:hypothetical protein